MRCLVMARPAAWAGMMVAAAGVAGAQTVAVPTPRPAEPPIQGAPAPESALAGEAAAKPVAKERVYQSACPALLDGLVAGKVIAPIEEGACGERSPLEITAIGSRAPIALAAPAKLSCAMAAGLADWAGDVQAAARDLLGVPVAQLTTAASYHCRRRNNAPDGKISEHGFANALDFSAIVLADGREISVERDWAMPAPAGETAQAEPAAPPTPQARFLRAIHTAACKRFTTVLGPEADVHHRDHVHMDLGCHGRNCTYRVCE